MKKISSILTLATALIFAGSQLASSQISTTTQPCPTGTPCPVTQPCLPTQPCPAGTPCPVVQPCPCPTGTPCPVTQPCPAPCPCPKTVKPSPTTKKMKANPHHIYKKTKYSGKKVVKP